MTVKAATVGALVGKKVGVAALGTAIPGTVPVMLIGAALFGLAATALKPKKEWWE